MKKLLLLVLMIGLLSGVTFVSAQDDDEPYLYYYSRMLGGLIIEHPDGSDSRLIGADVIPAGLTGIGGPGWSPSGKYFASNGFHYDAYTSSYSGMYLIDRQGNPVNPWLPRINAGWMQWSPTGEDLLLLIGTTESNYLRSTQFSFWILNASTGQILTEHEEIFGIREYELGRFVWETEQRRIRFYTHPETYDPSRYYQITMQFDGTVLKEPATQQEFEEHYTPPHDEDDTDIYNAHGVSPSGDYEASGKYPTILHNRITGEETELPTHSQGTNCRKYLWSENEDYIITLDGTLRAGGGCAPAVLGISDSLGQLWRELGGCSWDESCVGWLPPQVDVSALPPGQPKPIQLDPVAYEPSDMLESMGTDRAKLPDIRLHCTSETLDVIDGETQSILFQLARTDAEPCPYLYYYKTADKEIPIAMAYDPRHALLAIYVEYLAYEYTSNVTIWSMATNPGTPILRLNTYGYQLEFTPDGEQLRARNVSAWKIYNVSDILTAAGLTEAN